MQQLLTKLERIGVRPGHYRLLSVNNGYGLRTLGTDARCASNCRRMDKVHNYNVVGTDNAHNIMVVMSSWHRVIPPY